MIEKETQTETPAKYNEAILKSLESVTALEDGDVPILLDVHRVEKVSVPNSTERVFRHDDKLMLPSSSRTVVNKAAVRAESIFLSNQLLIKHMCHNSVFSENDFIKVFSNYPFEEDYDQDRKEVLISAGATILTRLWDELDSLHSRVSAERRLAVKDDKFSFGIPKVIDGRDFKDIDILYAAKGGDFNFPIGVSITYQGRTGEELNKAVLALPSTPEMDNNIGVEPSAILTKKAYLFIKEIFDVNNKITENVVKSIIGRILDDLIEQFGDGYFFANIEPKETTDDT